ncbi:T7-like phage primase/helicase protein [uncultured Thiomicrorhabdus sp.]
MSYEKTQNQYLYKTHCENPACGSSDANAVYSDGSTYCFSCAVSTRGGGTPTETKKRSSMAKFEPLTGDSKALKARGIYQTTCEEFGYFNSRAFNPKTEETEPCQVANIRDDSGVLLGQKVRFKDKEFIAKGKPQDGLFGMHRFKGGMKIVITEGEIDALSISQINDNKYPVVSLPTGAGKHTVGIVSKFIDYLDNFQEIVLFFDNDEPGQKAVKEVAAILPSAKVKIALMGEYKDANEALLANDARAITNAIWQAEAYKPDGLVTIDDVLEDLDKPVEMGFPWFLDSLTKHTYGRRWGDVIFLGAGTGVGKTDFFLQSINYDINVLGEKVGAFLLEQPVKESYDESQVNRKVTLHLPTVSAMYKDEFHEEIRKEAYRNITLYDSFGVTDWASVKSKMMYLIANGVRIFYIDHLTALATGSDDKSEREELEKITAEMATIAKKHEIFILCISHLTTPERKP